MNHGHDSTRVEVEGMLVNDANVGWWERAYAVALVAWSGVTALALERQCFPAGPARHPARGAAIAATEPAARA